VKRIRAEDLKSIRVLQDTPEPIRRTLEATWLLLWGTTIPSSLIEPPKWVTMQQMVSNPNILQEVLAFDKTELRANPALAAFVASRYFGVTLEIAGVKGATAGATAVKPEAGEVSWKVTSGAGTPARASGSSAAKGSRLSKAGSSITQTGATKLEPLTHDIVLQASKSEKGPAVALYKWCIMTLVDVATPESIVRERAEAASREEEAAKRKAEEEKEAEAMRRKAAEEAEENARKKDEARRREEEEAKRKANEEAAARAAAEAARRAAEESDAEARKRAASQAKASASAAKKVCDPGFGCHLTFEGDSEDFDSEQESILQTVAATICMRQSLGVELLAYSSSPDKSQLASRRLCIVKEFLAANGVPGVVMLDGTRAASTSHPPGVLCQLDFKGDAALSENFRSGQASASDSETQEIAEWIKDNFAALKC